MEARLFHYMLSAQTAATALLTAVDGRSRHRGEAVSLLLLLIEPSDETREP